MNVYLKTEGFVLRKRSLFHKDTLITFFTKDKGKITAVAKGIRSSFSKRISSLMTGNLLKLVFYSKKDRFYLQSSETISIFIKIKEKETKQKQLYFFLYMIDKLLPELQKEVEVYEQIKHMMVHLSKNELTVSHMVRIGNTLLRLFGYRENGNTWDEFVKNVEHILGGKIPTYII